MGSNLSSYTNQRSTVNLSIRQTCNEISGSGTGCSQDYSYSTRNPCITLGSVDGTLFMPCQYMLDLITVIVQCVIDRHNSTTWITENIFCILGNQRFHYNICSSNHCLLIYQLFIGHTTFRSRSNQLVVFL